MPETHTSSLSQTLSPTLSLKHTCFVSFTPTHFLSHTHTFIHSLSLSLSLSLHPLFRQFLSLTHIIILSLSLSHTHTDTNSASCLADSKPETHGHPGREKQKKKTSLKQGQSSRKTVALRIETLSPHSFIHTPLFSLSLLHIFSLSYTYIHSHTLSLSVSLSLSLSFTLHITVIDNYSLLFSTVTVIDKM